MFARKIDGDKGQAMRKSFELLFVIIFAPSAAAQSRDGQTVSIGPWAIATHYKTDKLKAAP